ncbi:MAG: MBL fold metallo-hydrolase [Clostridia bacterium]|nr:MBL fold metallo-hydrolase [Clostridia bacterium]MBQ3092734.1 MBL fold metallo-hydrolase [Clostridia bacterium]
MKQIKFYNVFSGSSGNCTYIEFESGEGILIDAGKSAKQIELFLSRNNININNLKYIFVTHEHTDHVSALKVLLKKYDIKVCASYGTLACLKDKDIINNNIKLQEVCAKKEYDIGFASIKPFDLPHDCEEGLGYVITDSSNKKMAICTDLGYISDEIKNNLKSCEAVIIESNHDVKMLENGPYPYSTKRRILSNLGHLSNETCSAILPFLIEHGTKNIVLSHLSSHNNLPELALESALNALINYGLRPEDNISISVAAPVNIKNEFCEV